MKLLIFFQEFHSMRYSPFANGACAECQSGNSSSSSDGGGSVSSGHSTEHNFLCFHRNPVRMHTTNILTTDNMQNAMEESFGVVI